MNITKMTWVIMFNIYDFSIKNVTFPITFWLKNVVTVMQFKRGSMHFHVPSPSRFTERSLGKQYRFPIITASKRSCGKVMFLQVSVCLGGGYPMSFLLVSLVPGLFRGVGVGMSGGWVCPAGGYPPDTTKHSRQAGGTHSPGTLSCLRVWLM